jgi:hypothetical protein
MCSVISGGSDTSGDSAAAATHKKNKTERRQFSQRWPKKSLI